MKTYDGTPIQLDGAEFIAPPLTIGQVRRMLPKIESIDMSGKLPKDADIVTMIEIVHMSLKRNYPAITMQEVEDGLDMRSLREVLQSVMTGSGLVLGNAPAATATTQAPLTGDGCTGN